MGAITSIQKALDIAFVQFGITNSIVTALEDIDAPTSTGTPYLASFNLPADVGVADLATTDLRDGIYQINISYASQLGSANRNKMADLLNTVFYSGATFTHGGVCVRIEDITTGPAIIGNGWSTTPLSINWSSYTDRI